MTVKASKTPAAMDLMNLRSRVGCILRALIGQISLRGRVRLVENLHFSVSAGFELTCFLSSQRRPRSPFHSCLLFFSISVFGALSQGIAACPPFLPCCNDALTAVLRRFAPCGNWPCQAFWKNSFRWTRCVPFNPHHFSGLCRLRL